MPYNTSAIPPRKEPTGQTQLPLSRVKKIISQDQDIIMCSNNAAFVITLAAEMFVQHLAEESHTQTKLDRKPRRNVQYKDVASAISHQDNLEFLEDTVPKTVPFKKIKAASAATQARLRGDNAADERPPSAHAAAPAPLPNGSGQTIVNGEEVGGAFSVPLRVDLAAGANAAASVSSRQDDPNEQLALEMRQAAGSPPNGDVDMTG